MPHWLPSWCQGMKSSGSWQQPTAAWTTPCRWVAWWVERLGRSLVRIGPPPTPFHYQGPSATDFMTPWSGPSLFLSLESNLLQLSTQHPAQIHYLQPHASLSPFMPPCNVPFQYPPHTTHPHLHFPPWHAILKSALTLLPCRPSTATSSTAPSPPRPAAPPSSAPPCPASALGSCRGPCARSGRDPACRHPPLRERKREREEGERGREREECRGCWGWHGAIASRLHFTMWPLEGLLLNCARLGL